MFSIFIGAEYVHHQFPSDLPSQVIKALNATALGYWIFINILVAIILEHHQDNVDDFDFREEEYIFQAVPTLG